MHSTGKMFDTVKKPIPNLRHSRLSQCVFCQCVPSYYLQSFQLDQSKYRQIELYSNYWRVLNRSNVNAIMQLMMNTDFKTNNL